MTTDGWVLTSVWFSGPIRRRDPVSWSWLVGAADWINHAILTREEAGSSIRALGERRLLRERAGVISLTPAARKGLAAAYGKRKRMGVFKVWAAADALIALQKPGGAKLRGPGPSVFARAVEAYYERNRS